MGHDLFKVPGGYMEARYLQEGSEVEGVDGQMLKVEYNFRSSPQQQDLVTLRTEHATLTVTRNHRVMTVR